MAVAAALAAASLMWVTASANGAGAGMSQSAGAASCGTTSLGSISQPKDTVFGPDGNLWFIDNQPPWVGRMTPDGHVTFFGAGLLLDRDLLQSITVGPDGNLWFTASSAASTQSRIGRITTAGVMTMFSAGITPGSSVQGITAGPDGNLWFTEPGKAEIGRITTSGVVTEFPAPSLTHGALNITAGPGGKLWFTAPGEIGSITTTGVVTDFTNGFAPPPDPNHPVDVLYAGPWAIAAGPDGNLWFTTFPGTHGNTAVGKMTPAGAVTNFAVPLPTAALQDITNGPDGNLWFDDLGGRIGRVTPAGAVTMFAATFSFDGGTSPTAPLGITPGPDGHLWYANLLDTGLTGRTAAFGRISTDGVIDLPTVGTTPYGAPTADVTAGPDGNIWFTDQLGTGRVSPDGFVTQFAHGFLQNRDSFPLGITAGPDGNLWFADAGLNRIVRVTTAGVATDFSAGITPGSQPQFIARGPDGNLWFTETQGGRIGRITPSGTVTEFSAGITPGSQPVDITAGPDNNLWFTETSADNTSGHIGRITTSGVVTEFAVTPGIFGSELLNGITTGPDNNIWFTDQGDRIGRITPSGTLTMFSQGIEPVDPVVGPLPAFPTDIVAANGALWFTETFPGKIGRITTDGTITLSDSVGSNYGTASFLPFPSYPLSHPRAIAASSDGGLWWTDGAPLAIGHTTAGDRIGDPCNPDEDGDGFPDVNDPFPFNPDTSFTTVTGSRQGNVTVPTGTTTFVNNATVTGSIIVQPGGRLSVKDSTVGGAVTTSKASRVEMCGSKVAGAVTISGTTSFVVIGGANRFCDGNTLGGAVLLTNNTGGIEVSDNTITGTLSLSGNTGGWPPPTPAAPAVEANTAGSLTCSSNTPAPTNNGQPNTVKGPRTGQCSGL